MSTLLLHLPDIRTPFQCRSLKVEIQGNKRFNDCLLTHSKRFLVSTSHLPSCSKFVMFFRRHSTTEAPSLPTIHQKKEPECEGCEWCAVACSIVALDAWTPL